MKISMAEAGAFDSDHDLAPIGRRARHLIDDQAFTVGVQPCCFRTAPTFQTTVVRDEFAAPVPRHRQKTGGRTGDLQALTGADPNDP